MLTTFRPKGKPIAASTRNTYYQIFNGALNAAVRAKRLLRNPFNEMEKSEKPKMPESVRSYMTIEEVRALIATPMQEGRVKKCLSVLLLLRTAYQRYCRPEMEECLCR